MSAVDTSRDLITFLQNFIPSALMDDELRPFLLDHVDILPHEARITMAESAASAGSEIRDSVFSALSRWPDLYSSFMVGGQIAQGQQPYDRGVDRDVNPEEALAILNHIERNFRSASSKTLGGFVETLDFLASSIVFSTAQPSLRILFIIFATLGRIRIRLGDFAAAMDLYGRALQITYDSSGSPEQRISLRDTSLLLGDIADALQTKGDSAGALTRAAESLKQAERHLELEGIRPESLVCASLAHERLSDVLVAEGDFTSAYTHLAAGNELLHLSTQLFGENPQYLRNLSVILNKQGSIHRKLGEFEAALTRFSDALNLRLRVAEITENSLESRFDISRSLQMIGSLSTSLRNWAEGKTHLLLALQLASEVLQEAGEHPTLLSHLSSVEEALGDLATEENETGVDALAHYFKALEFEERALAITDEWPLPARAKASTCERIARVYARQGDWTSSEAFSKATLDLRRFVYEQIGPQPDCLIELVTALHNMAGLNIGSVKQQAEWLIEALNLVQLFKSRFGLPPRVEELEESLTKMLSSRAP